MANPNRNATQTQTQTQETQTQVTQEVKPQSDIFSLDIGAKDRRESLRLFTDRLELAYKSITDIETEIKTAFRKSGVLLNRVNVPTGDGAEGKVNISAKTLEAKAKIREFVDTLPADINVEFSSDRSKGIDYYTISF